ncbi:MAG: hypothetical protein QOI74_1304 [Micromonosporaceae bacterium]|jgi:hypothetical protein|nr:hypothetical protein [Micromonosporaceae bacterium]
MADTDGSTAVDTDRVDQADQPNPTPRAVQVDGVHFLKPDSALVRTALDLLATHVADPAGECVHCGVRYPCATVQHARQVVNAGGVARAPVDDGWPDEPAGAGPAPAGQATPGVAPAGAEGGVDSSNGAAAGEALAG